MSVIFIVLVEYHDDGMVTRTISKKDKILNSTVTFFFFAQENVEDVIYLS